MYSRIVSDSEWGDKKVAENYLERYWLSENEYRSIWEPIQKQIFVHEKDGLTNFIFADGFKIFAFRGGCLFDQEDFERLQRCFTAIGESYFVIVENSFGNQELVPRFRMKFPTVIDWKELISGNFVSSILVEMPHKEYFVFGNSGGWGKYVANDYKDPLDILGFKPEHGTVFYEELRTSAEENAEIYTWLPQLYKKRLEKPGICD